VSSAKKSISSLTLRFRCACLREGFLLMKKVFSGRVMCTLLTFVVITVSLTSCVLEDDFPVLEQSPQSRKEALDSMQRFRINGVEGSNDWIVDNWGVTLSATGFAVVGGTMRTTNGDMFYPAMVYFPEEVNGITVYHALPIFVTWKTSFREFASEDRADSVDDSIVVDTSEGVPFFIDIHSSLSQQSQLVSVNFSIHDGWIRADGIQEYGNLAHKRSETSDALESLNIMPQQRSLLNSVPHNEYWLDISEGEVVELHGMVDNSKRYIRASSSLGSAIMYHVLRIYGLEESEVQSLEEATVPIVLVGDRLIYAGNE